MPSPRAQSRDISWTRTILGSCLRLLREEEGEEQGDLEGDEGEEEEGLCNQSSPTFWLDSILCYLLYLTTEINQLYYNHAFTKFSITYVVAAGKLIHAKLAEEIRKQIFQNHSDTECAMPTSLPRPNLE